MNPEKKLSPAEQKQLAEFAQNNALNAASQMLQARIAQLMAGKSKSIYTKKVGPAHVAKRRKANKVARLSRRKNRRKK